MNSAVRGDFYPLDLNVPLFSHLTDDKIEAQTSLHRSVIEGTLLGFFTGGLLAGELLTCAG